MDFFLILGLAFLGGLLLNVTPCMLPVISLKVLNFAKMAGESAMGRVWHGLIYGMGIVASFLLLAAFVVGIQWAGGLAHWGFHFQSPLFLGSMVVVCGAMGLNSLFPSLWGTLCGGVGRVLEGLGLKRSEAKEMRISRMAKIFSWLSNVPHTIKEKTPYLGSFCHGGLTTLIGSACCGPFLGYAMGMALAASSPVIFAAFLAAGLGMALPYVVLSVIPKALAWLPKGGKWLKAIKITAGSGMLLTAVWFLFLLI